MSNLILALILQFHKTTDGVRSYARGFCERHLVADDPYDGQEAEEEMRKLRLTYPELFRGKE